MEMKLKANFTCFKEQKWPLLIAPTALFVLRIQLHNEIRVSVEDCFSQT